VSRRRLAAGVLGAATAGWGLRHATSPAVRGWTRPRAGTFRRAGPLTVRDAGAGDHPLVLLHGITGSNLVWGGAYDTLAARRRLVVPDLLGFGGSVNSPDERYGLTDHLDALDAMAADLGLDGVPMTIVGWSLGALVALHWAARRTETTDVVGFCAPLYRTSEEADTHIRAMGIMEQLFALESPLARLTCRLMCRYRRQAQWLSVAISPQWPVPVARSGVQHTWDSYLGAMNDIIRDSPWPDALATLDARGVPVTLADGGADPVTVTGLSDHLAETHRCVTTRRHAEAAHDLPLGYPSWCLDVLGAGDRNQRYYDA
jgi:pimeloyl-ACP methyl ester carboxylesterase